MELPPKPILGLWTQAALRKDYRCRLQCTSSIARLSALLSCRIAQNLRVTDFRIERAEFWADSAQHSDVISA